MPTENDLGILREVGVRDNYMAPTYSSTDAWNTDPFPRIFVKFPARIIDEVSAGSGSARFEVETNRFDETELTCSIDDFTTSYNPSSGIVEFTDLSAGDYVLKVKYQPFDFPFILEVPFTIYKVGEYGLYYVNQWNDFETDMVWSVNIWKRGFTGDFTEIKQSGNPASIDWGFDAGQDIYNQVVMPSKCTIQLMVQEEGQFEELFTETDPFMYRIDIKENTSTRWRGWIADNQYSYPLRDTPYPISLVATDGLGLLSSNYASSGNRASNRVKWNHDKISITELLWAIKRELRFQIVEDVESVNIDRIIYHSLLIPESHNTDYPALFSHMVNLSEIIPQGDDDDEMSLMQLLQTILQPQFHRLVSYGGDWYMTSMLKFDTDDIAVYNQMSYDYFETDEISDVHRRIGGKGDAVEPSTEWRNNDQIVSFTSIYDNTRLSHATKVNQLIFSGPYLVPLVGVTRYLKNNAPGWFVFWSTNLPTPGPLGTDVIFDRLYGKNIIGIPGYQGPVGGYFGTENKPLVRHSDTNIHTRIRIKFNSLYLDYGTDNKVWMQLLCAGYYYQVFEDEIDGLPEWVPIDFGTTAYIDMRIVVTPATGAGFSDASKKHEIITKYLPEEITPILTEEHVSFRIMATETTSTDNLIFIESLEITQEWVEEDDDGSIRLVNSQILKQQTINLGSDRDDVLKYELGYWNGTDVNGAIVTRGNVVSMPDNSVIQNVTYSGQAYNMVDYMLNHISASNAVRRMVIDGSIQQSVRPFIQPRYRDKEYQIVQLTHNLKAGVSLCKMVEMNDNYTGAYSADSSVFRCIPSTVMEDPNSVAFVVGLSASGTFSVNWGDGVTEEFSTAFSISIDHTYSTDGPYLIIILPVVSDVTQISWTGAVGDGPYSNNVSEILNLANTLTLIDCSANEVSVISCTIPASCHAIFLDQNNLTTSIVNQVLIDANDGGGSAGTLRIEDQATPAPPSGDGITALAALESNGWDITTD